MDSVGYSSVFFPANVQGLNQLPCHHRPRSGLSTPRQGVGPDSSRKRRTEDVRDAALRLLKMPHHDKTYHSFVVSALRANSGQRRPNRPGNGALIGRRELATPVRQNAKLATGTGREAADVAVQEHLRVSPQLCG